MTSPNLTTVVFSHWSDKLVRNAHLRPPSTEMLRTTLQRASALLGGLHGVLYHDDGFGDDEPNTVERQSRMIYADAVKACAIDYGLTFMHPARRAGYREAFLAVFGNPTAIITPRYFWLEHDWWLQSSAQPLINDALDVMGGDPTVNYIRLPNYHDELERFASPPLDIPCYLHTARRPLTHVGRLMPDSLWSTNPHFGRTNFLRALAAMVHNNHIGPLVTENGWACGIEEVIVNTYLEAITKYGFERAHHTMQVYLAAPGHDFTSCMEHMGV